MIELDEKKVASAMAVEAQSYLWELWLSDRYPKYNPAPERYFQKILSMNDFCEKCDIPCKVLIDNDVNISDPLPYAIKVNDEKIEFFSKFRKDFEEKVSEKGNIWDKIYGGDHT